MYYRTKKQVVRIRYFYFILGAILGLSVGVMSQKLSAFDENGEVVCLAKNIYFEAGNQPLAGKVAVAQVVFNRMEDYIIWISLYTVYLRGLSPPALILY